MTRFLGHTLIAKLLSILSLCSLSNTSLPSSLSIKNKSPRFANLRNRPLAAILLSDMFGVLCEILSMGLTCALGKNINIHSSTMKMKKYLFHMTAVRIFLLLLQARGCRMILYQLNQYNNCIVFISSRRKPIYWV